MQIKIYRDYEEMSKEIAMFIADYISKKPDAVLCFPAGDTPEGTFKHLADMYRNGKANFQQCTFIGLDEWVGMDRYTDGSCKRFMYEKLFVPLNIQESDIYFFDACSADLERECERIDEVICRKGRIDLMFVGLGMNGHIGLNEPGTDFNSYSHVVDLDPVTMNVGKKYFKDDIQLEKGITLGLRHLMEADVVLLAANGGRKADIVRKVIESDVTNQVPASIIQKKERCFIYLDSSAAAKITGVGNP